MAFGTGLGPVLGGNSSALNIGTATVIKATAGTFWSGQITSIGTGPGYLYDANSLTNLNTARVLLTIQAGQSGPIGGAFPVPFFIGLVFVPFSDMTASIFYS